MTAADDFARELQALCVERNYAGIEVYVRADGRVEFTAYDGKRNVIARFEADLFPGGPLKLPSRVVKQWEDAP